MKQLLVLVSILSFLPVLPVLPVYAQVDYPPAYPRSGADKVLENQHVIVWNISWLKQDYPVHRHRYPHTGVYYSAGDRVITSLDGEARDVHTDAWNISYQPSGVTHTETGVSEEPLQAIFIQIKRDTQSVDTQSIIVESDGIPAFPFDSPLDRRANERVRVWEYPPGLNQTGSALHVHLHDAVVVWFDEENAPNVHFISQGTQHAGEIPSAAIRVFVFEIL